MARDETDAAARLASVLAPFMHADDRTEERDPALAARLAAKYARDASTALLPVVRELGDLRAAEAVRRAFIDAADEATHLGRRGPNAVGDWLLDYGQNRAATLRGEAGR